MSIATSHGMRSVLGTCVFVLACGSGDTRRLSPVSVALSEGVPPVYDDGELTIYEAKTSLMLPIVAPGESDMARLRAEPSDPFERQPWITHEDVGVQVTWTLSNLDGTDRSVWVMIDPYNEFGRYQPAIVVTDEQATRHLSGIDMLFLLPGTASEQAGGGAAEPRVVGTFTFDDMDELALDFATVFKILEDAAPVDDSEDDPRATLVNYAFNVRNRSYNSPLLDAYRPSTAPGLVGFDFGVRSFEPANIALEILVEIVDHRGGRVAARGQSVRLLEAPEAVISVAAP
jgi:hypothetical protein